MISLATLHIGDPCPCGDGRLVLVDPKRDTFRCYKITTNGTGRHPYSVHTDHFPMPTSGPGAYTNMTNVAVTPPRGANATATVGPGGWHSIKVTWTDPAAANPAAPRPAPPAIDRARYPHICPTCRGAVYRGFSVIEHAATGGARCP